MPIPVGCPSCGRKLSAPDHLEGRKIKCRRCSTTFIVAAPPIRPRREEKEATSATLSSRLMVEEDEVVQEEATHLAADKPVPIQITRVDETIPSYLKRIPYGFGVPSLVLGILALLFCYVLSRWVPMLSYLSMPLASMGLFLGIGGIVGSIIQGGKKIIFFTTIGPTVCLLALALGILGIMRDPLIGKLRALLGAGDTLAGASSDLLSVPTNLGKQEEPQASKKEPREEFDWTTATNASKDPIKHGDIVVIVASAAIAKITIKDILGDSSQRDQEYLVLQLNIGNHGQTKKLDFSGWSGASAPPDLTKALLSAQKGDLAGALGGGARYAATLSDDLGNEYRRVNLEQGESIVGQVSGMKPVYPGKIIDDLLVFEVPVGAAKSLRLELPAGAFGGTGTLRFEIPRRMIRR